ncbi:uncharacterized protein K460DRAFT_368389 [Cucurbitaria berberidis CBS 394.84]|uniref:Uncharacterized protein n=1 Tax=Cucurbitaria berberidis CBS 394.84 TaxID=1168544 RepID=A0A9P4L610_9PLEO|nr:uncharacterized protein K460DRAFT_368389 [Cucurbitaria berberidis CBS 394.84]KAF1843486.1 hypothetical protein K460DRAFT_368389 [Cucurbitaria berberidis CBS 394.84]
MTWWRRDPTLSPVHRYAQRLLRSHALRTRCFSRTPPSSAKHEDDDGTKRPAGMSSLEWMQLQHYKQWTKRLRDDPYHAIFGASNDMLSGKGLKDWEWISKRFPRWMVREMGFGDALDKDKDMRHDRYTREYRKRSIRDEGSPAPSKKAQSASADSSYSRQEYHFPEPSFRAARLERDDSTGIISPSDSRRPREHSHVRAVGHAPELDVTQKSKTDNASPLPTPPQSKYTSTQIPKVRSTIPAKTEPPSNEASARGPSSIEFMTKKAQDQDPYLEDSLNESRMWRQTALQRRSSRGPMVSPKIMTPPIAKTSDEVTSKATLPIAEDVERLATQGTEETLEVRPVETTNKNTDWAVQQEPSTRVVEVTKDSAGIPRSTSKILDQLPKDDIDLLTAAEIRSSMGVKRSKIPSDEVRWAERQKLEETFKDTHKTDQEIDSMLESKVINDQLVRRLERQMQQGQKSSEPIQTQTEQEPTIHTLTGDVPIESSIDRMKNWLEKGGAIFSNHFWQDPTEEADAKKTKLFFDKVVAHIRKGRVAMKQVAEDLEKDVPATKPLLKRLKDDENMLDMAIHALRLRSETRKPQALTPKKLKAIQALRLKFQDTDRELDAAYMTLRDLEKKDAAKGASVVLKRRLNIASKTCHKSAQLTRYLIWSIQARLEDPEVDQSRLVHYKAVANSLLTLRDTQMALARLVDRAILIYGPVPEAQGMGQKYGVEASPEVTKDREQKESSIISQPDKATIRANVAADERLANEVEAQKLAMRGLSDDGYARTPKLAPKKVFDEQSPLAHSLFRPFGPVLESLGKETPESVEAAKGNKDAKKELNDAKLVAEIRQVYEDTYGPITVEHIQLSDGAEEVKKGQEKNMKTFEMLKEDPASIHHPNAINSLETREKSTEIPESAAIAPKGSLEHPASVTPEIPAVEFETLQTSATDSTSPPTTGATTAEINPSFSQPAGDAPADTTSSSLSSFPSTEDLPTHYTILIHDPLSDNLSITTSTTSPPRDTSRAVPLHQAFATLDAPTKFVPFITDGLEVVSANKHMLVLRDALDDSSSTRAFETVGSPSSSPTVSDSLEFGKTQVNPIDGTARLSPTGYVGPEESQEQLEKEFEDRREAASKLRSSKENSHHGFSQDNKETKGRKRGGAGGVAKTAIWAAAVCYVVGVFGEIATSPFKT